MNPAVAIAHVRRGTMSQAGADNRLAHLVRSWPLPLILLVTAVIYFGAAELGLLLTFDASNVSTVWPATGLAVAGMLLLGYRIWPGIAAGALLASVISYTDGDGSFAAILLASFLVTVASTGQVVLAVYLYRLFIKALNPFDQIVDTFKYLVYLGLVSPAVGAVVGVAGICLAGFAAWSDFLLLWFIWWVAAMSSILIIASFFLAWIVDSRLDTRRNRVIEAVASLTAFIAILGLMLFSPDSVSPLLGVLILPFIFSFIWASVRFGHRGATTAIMLMWLTFLIAVIAGISEEDPPVPQYESLYLVAFYMAVFAAATFIPSAMVKESKESKVRLQTAKDDVERANAELSAANLELKKENRQRQQAQAELEASNAELQRFAYVASHDLQEPLRMVASFVQLLAENYKDRLDENAMEYVAFAVEGATRMQKMIEDLLLFSRVGTSREPFSVCNFDEALDQALSYLQFSLEECGAQVTRDQLPVLPADPSQITQIFQNLIGNAIKFRGDDPPRVHVSARRTDGDWEFSVSDNGLGIDPKYFERIFVIFQRLQKRAAYPGTGIGLALCKRIVERHNGKIWVTSEPGAGSTFYFTIPLTKGAE